ncbi:MAG: Hsp33 family molecular chaperone HslO, partial [Kiritimatiellae bacterium]|nr:Hsp33 family molecular chaperone HslO [Kiritimatiellia bacterium]MBR1836135.1 Hsp33 family molecular chaperone HslO [Kiritimatiellia bacterium]
GGGDGDDNDGGDGGAPANPSRDPAEKTLCGPSASAKMTRFQADGAMRSQVVLQSKPGTPEAVYGNLLGAALPTCLSLVATTYRGEPDRVRALAMQTLPGGSRNDFARLEKLFDDGTLADMLAFDATLPTMREILGLSDLFTGPTRALAFGCSCSEEKAALSLASFPPSPETSAAAPLKFRCHLCGREMEIAPEAVEEARAALRRGGRGRRAREGGRG